MLFLILISKLLWHKAGMPPSNTVPSVSHGPQTSREGCLQVLGCPGKLELETGAEAAAPATVTAGPASRSRRDSTDHITSLSPDATYQVPWLGLVVSCMLTEVVKNIRHDSLRMST